MRTFQLVVFVLFSCALWSAKPRAGIYRGTLLIDQRQNTELPFIFELRYNGRKPLIVIHNADERIKVTDVRIKGDSLNFKMPVFDTEFRTRITESGLKGVWINHYRKNENTIPFTANFGQQNRFVPDAPEGSKNIEGKWECLFGTETKSPDKAIGRFHHIEQTPFISGTFITETGDYRYLEGVLNNDTLKLSTFDGSHAFLFTALLRNDSLVNGTFYSGSHWQQSWFAMRNPEFKLRDPEKITFVKDTGKTVDFAFKSTRGKTVSLSNRKFRNKPVIIQVMGSWCPNCMDESVYLSELYEKYKKAGLAVVALAFEKTSDESRAMRQLRSMQRKLNINYDVLLTGSTGKEAASKSLPAISGISAFPTTIFLNRRHEIIKIHTGFSGPATGREYEAFKLKTENLIQNLLK